MNYQSSIRFDKAIWLSTFCVDDSVCTTQNRNLNESRSWRNLQISINVDFQFIHVILRTDVDNLFEGDGYTIFSLQSMLKIQNNNHCKDFI